MEDEKKIKEEILEEIKKVKKTEDTSKEESKQEIKKEHHKRVGKHECREEEYLFGWKRCMADFENYKKRQQENQKSLGEYLKIDSTLQILPVIDNFRSATEHIPVEQKEVPWVVGIMYIQKQLEDILKENGVTEMDVKVGDEFDPNLHEAVSDSKLPARNASHNDAGGRMESESTNGDKELGNKIKKIVLKGYKLGPARNTSPARNDVATSGEHSDAGGGKVIRAARVVVE
jgi:molecular chaperone GrpE